MRISDLNITDEYDTISKHATLSEAAKKILALERGVLVVVDDKLPMGIVTDSHMLVAMSNDLDCRVEKCEDHLDSNILSVNYNSTVKEAALMMNVKKPIAVTVVDDNLKLVGYFSPNDYRDAIASYNA
jgi:predicted transcriptional regulator